MVFRKFEDKNGELCTWFDKQELGVFIFPFIMSIGNTCNVHNVVRILTKNFINKVSNNIISL